MLDALTLQLSDFGPFAPTFRAGRPCASPKVARRASPALRRRVGIDSVCRRPAQYSQNIEAGRLSHTGSASRRAPAEYISPFKNNANFRRKSIVTNRRTAVLTDRRVRRGQASRLNFLSGLVRDRKQYPGDVTSGNESRQICARVCRRGAPSGSASPLRLRSFARRFYVHNGRRPGRDYRPNVNTKNETRANWSYPFFSPETRSKLTTFLRESRQISGEDSSLGLSSIETRSRSNFGQCTVWCRSAPHTRPSKSLNRRGPF
ncbi:hypothetical protein EVAR_75920_1 [Eumeta japonica]|uniref:Uncharacterized protein n=1 Tax=Eumeta variegata TaxID=151549 RepID=A0A4C1UXH2_EUMVA|nr:hypothetical protein EVAR_75920_1 [Eumeta japonica]